MKISELPEYLRFYDLEIRSDIKKTYSINGLTKQSILSSRSQFIELPTGEIINKSFIVSISLDIDKTRSVLKELPEFERRQLKDSAQSIIPKS